ncbi:PLP-dependent transferase [Pseudomonas aeruginosa]|uniref:trans-sulfuration enzyme family protein n=1 Tax=Pseudomonas aeruginosa TaxID=287 RepID=UPI001B36A082|nr:PLP-dependent aspartate aminotransferase family protein [Pseudomonas aeruginosa]MBP8481200.1 PLP-dependent transferase [Pseudomonas aeruginosa]
MSQHDQHPDAPAQAFATRVIHAGQAPDPSTGAIMPPIYANSTYIQESPGVHKGLDYGRSHNPTRWALERCVADLEGGTQAFAFASGLAAISSVLELLDAGSHIVSGNDLYGGTFRLFERVRRRSAGHRFSFVDPTDLQAFEAALTPETRMVWVETPSNPLLRLTDLRAIAQLCRARGIISVADNTFVGDNPDLRERLGFLQNSVGAISGPFDAFLTLRGVKTLALRMERHCSNALALAQWLERQPQVARVYYPGLASHPQHELAKRQMRGFGGMISLDLRCDLAGARRFLENVRIFSLAESLGGVESLIEHPAIMTHASIPAETRAELGIGDSLIRLSVGVEALEDLQADLAQALAKI